MLRHPIAAGSSPAVPDDTRARGYRKCLVTGTIFLGRDATAQERKYDIEAGIVTIAKSSLKMDEISKVV
jgi:hypothetical protein